MFIQMGAALSFFWFLCAWCWLCAITEKNPGAFFSHSLLLVGFPYLSYLVW